MKTVTIKFHEYSKEYNFTAPDFIEIDNFVLVHTLGEFKIVRVVDTDNSIDTKNKEIITKVDMNTDNIRILNHYTVVEVIKYKNIFYNIPIFTKQFHEYNDWEILKIANALFHRQKNFYLIESECFEERLNYKQKYSYYRSFTIFEKNLVKINIEELSKEKSEKFLKNLSTDITKAKNFAKYKNDYIEINEEDN